MPQTGHLFFNCRAHPWPFTFAFCPMLFAISYIAPMLGQTRDAYERFFEARSGPPLYAASWWLDATCGSDGWEINTMGKPINDAQVMIPYHRKKIKGLSSIINPPLTQWLPVINTTPYKISVNEFLFGLPPHSILDVCFRPEESMIHPADNIPMAFKYSYILSHAEHKNDIRTSYNEGLRRNLKEAEKNYSIVESDDIPMFLQLCKSTYGQRNMKPPPWTESIIPGLYKELKKHSCGKLELAMLGKQPIASILTAWDTKTSYYLLGGRTDGAQAASAHALLLDQAIKTAFNANRQFDFEGSMHPGIANFFQSFGASPEAYWQIRKFRGAGKLWALLQ